MSDQDIERYLFDPAAPAAGDVVELEQRLRPLRYDAESHPLRAPVVRIRSRQIAVRRWLQTAAVAASLAIVSLGGARWIWSWPAGRSWEVVSIDSAKRLDVGKTLVVADEPLLVRIARIGWMRVGEGSALTLLSTETTRHQLALRTGAVRVRVWAPPRSISFDTPAGSVTDLGCEFFMLVDEEMTRVEVKSGWVRLHNAAGEALVPVGASSHMRPGRQPVVPVFLDADPAFRAAVRRLEESPANAAQIDGVIRLARRSDVLTLLLLAQRNARDRQRLLERAAELSPPPGQQTQSKAEGGDPAAVGTWIESLPLPPVGSWLRNWTDWLPLPTDSPR
ncbi:MAG TPA: hypothetical protein VFL80_06810 [Thermoanaerobaculia bacterium]|nr:hypothetical protein [Thermoanaerobaculia bacterium]